MKKQIISILLIVAMIFTSMDITVLAAEVESNESSQMQTEEFVIAEEVTETTEEIPKETVQEENVSEEEVSEEQISDNIDEVVSESVSTDMANEWESSQEQSTSETENEEITVEDDNENEYETETQEQILETDTDLIDLTETDTEIVEVEEDVSETEPLETEQDEDGIAVESSNDLNNAVKNKILSFKSKYPEGKNWDPSGNGWRGLAWECYGFVITMEGLVFKDYPTNKHLRSTGNGQTVEGWTCYYVNSNNYNSLVVEPGDVIDCPTSDQWNHTAMVLSIDNGVITCVQANNGGNNLVYWTQCFNYNKSNSTLKNIYTKYSKYITGSKASKYMRLWKPSDKVKSDATGYTESKPTGPSTLKINDASYPSSIQQGSSWTCRGTISSNYMITHVGGYILASDDSTIIYEKSVNPSSTSYILANSEVDKALLFNKLNAGTYYYKITAHDSSGNKLTLIDTKFIIAGQCDFSGDLYSPANGDMITESYITVQAFTSDCYEICNYDIILSYTHLGVAQEKKERIVPYRTQAGYACNYNMDLPTETDGTYTVTVKAVCENGQTHIVGSNTFSSKKEDCSFVGSIAIPESNLTIQTNPTIKIRAGAADHYKIKNFIITVSHYDFITQTRIEDRKINNIEPSEQVVFAICEYSLELPAEGDYTVTVEAVCNDEKIHVVGTREFIYDNNIPTIKDVGFFTSGGNFYYWISADDNTYLEKCWIVVRDEAGNDKKFEDEIFENGRCYIWNDITGLQLFGKYAITFYVQDIAGNIASQTLSDIVISEVSINPEKIN